MRLNEREMVAGNSCVLVPYCRKHVAKYHNWMKNEELLKATSSEPLTLDEEFEMQKAWQDDPDKLTFIVLDRQILDETGDEIASMAGDINAFFLVDDHQLSTNRCFELSVMVAEPSSRRRGIAQEACKLMVLYILRRIGDSDFVAKIEEVNLASASLFQQKLNFQRHSHSEVFQLTTYKLNAGEANDWAKNIDLEVRAY